MTITTTTIIIIIIIIISRIIISAAVSERSRQVQQQKGTDKQQWTRSRGKSKEQIKTRRSNKNTKQHQGTGVRCSNWKPQQGV
jgi:hypothetical protein